MERAPRRVLWLPLLVAAAIVFAQLLRLLLEGEVPLVERVDVGGRGPGFIAAFAPHEHRAIQETLEGAWRECRSTLSDEERRELAAVVLRESLRQGYDPFFVQAMIEVESMCRRRVRGTRGAIGLVQIKPSTARAMAKEIDLPWKGAAMLHDPATNLRLGLHYLRKLENRFDSRYVAIVAYNAGPTLARKIDEGRAQRWPYVRKIFQRYQVLAAESGR